MKINVKGQNVVHASDIVCPAGFEVVNKDLYICTIEEANASFDIDIYANRGRGFKTFNENRELINSLSLISTDSNYSPIIRVGYDVHDVKISKHVTGDELVMQVATNGAILPQDALAIAAKIMIDHLDPLLQINETIRDLKTINEQNEQVRINTLSIPIEDLDLSVRSYNCLKRKGIQTIQELTSMSRSEVEKIKNLGKKSLREIQKRLTDYGLSFKEE